MEKCRLTAQKLTLPNLITVFVIAIVTNAGSNYAQSMFFPEMWRSDPFTGKQGDELKLYCQGVDDKVETIRNNPVPTWLIERIDRIQKEVVSNSKFCEDMARKMKH